MINPELKPFLADWAAGWATLAPGGGPAERRAHFEIVAAAMRQPTPEGVETGEHWVERNGRRVRLRWFRRPSASPQAALIYLHGGAWMQGSPETHWDITAGLAAATGRAVFSVDYAKSPEHPFPAAVDDCLAVYRALVEAGTTPRAIAGDSAGGNLTLITLMFFLQVAPAWQLVYPIPAASGVSFLLWPVITNLVCFGVALAIDRLWPRKGSEGLRV